MIAFATILVAILCQVSNSHQSLESLVVFFRHGDRTPDFELTYPKNPYKNYRNFSYGHGELTYNGKQNSIYLGNKLRKMYSKYLNSINAGNISLTSTEYNRTINTLHLVLNGLFNSTNTLNQAIRLNDLHINISHIKNGSTLSHPYMKCLRYRQLYDNFEKSEEGQKVLNKYNVHFPYLTEHTGVHPRHLFDLSLIYACLQPEEESGLRLPEWVSKVSLDYFKSSTLDYNRYSVAFPEFNKLYGGFILQEILTNLDQIIRFNNRKLYIYAGHDYNIVGLLGAMKIYRPHIISYLGCIVIELHKINDKYYIKVLYQRQPSQRFTQMRIPECRRLCPLESFKKIVDSNIPQNGDNCNQ